MRESRRLKHRRAVAYIRVVYNFDFRQNKYGSLSKKSSETKADNYLNIFQARHVDASSQHQHHQHYHYQPNPLPQHPARGHRRSSSVSIPNDYTMVAVPTLLFPSSLSRPDSPVGNISRSTGVALGTRRFLSALPALGRACTALGRACTALGRAWTMPGGVMLLCLIRSTIRRVSKPTLMLAKRPVGERVGERAQ